MSGSAMTIQKKYGWLDSVETRYSSSTQVKRLLLKLLRLMNGDRSNKTVGRELRRWGYEGLIIIGFYSVLRKSLVKGF